MTVTRLSLLLVLLSLLVASAASAATRTVAVLPMTKGAGGPELDGFGAALADMMVTDLSTVPDLQLVERQRLADVLAELELGETDFVDEKSAQKMGRGLGAEMVIVGSFSVVQERLVIDVRMVGVATGAVIKAARAEGEVAEFVSIEKDVVEGLVDGLEVELSRADRRRLLLQTPTEDFEAFASYGRGVKARSEGELDTARAAFEEALRRDPEFAGAAEELASLAALVRKEQEKERVRYADARTATLYGALEQLPAETSRGAKFQDTRESLMDLSMRWYLLTRSDQHCQRFEEMVHHLVRKDGETVSWWEDLPGDPRARYAAAEALFEARAAELGVTGEETLFGTRKGEAMHSAGMQLGRPSGLVLARNMKPEAFSDSLVYSMERCLPLETRAAKWDELRELAEGWGFLDDPLYKMWDGGEVTVTPRDSMDLYAAMARAKARGVDAEVSRMTEAVLARHPEGDGGRRRILSRISEVVQAGESYEGRLAGRMGWSAEALAGAARAVGDGDASLVRLDVPMCASMTERRKDRVDKELERYAEKLAEEQERFRLDAGVSLGGFLAPMILAGCFEGEQPVLKTDEAYPAIREALDRRHPATLDDEGCSESIATLAEAVNDEAEEKLLALAEDMRGYTIEGMLHQVYSLTWRRCLIGVRPRH